jgi:hypothetical protein
MEKITLVFDFEDKLSFSKLAKSFVEFNKLINLTSQLEDSLKDKLLGLDKFSENEIILITEQLKNKDRRFSIKRTQVEIQKISMNSPLELIVYSDMTIHIAIILLGGKRTGLFKYVIPIGLIEHIRRFTTKLTKANKK